MRSIHQARPDYPMLIGIGVSAALLVLGFLAIMTCLATHFWAVALASKYSDWSMTLLTLCVPGFSHAYWWRNWPHLPAAQWPNPLEPIAGQGWFTGLSLFWLVVFVGIALVVYLAPRLQPSLGRLMHAVWTVAKKVKNAAFPRVS